MMRYGLTVPAILRRAATFSGGVEIVSREADGALHRYSYRDMIGRASRLAHLLESYGIRQGDRVATLAWNHRRHLEAYFAIPSLGAVLHTLNLRLHPDELAYIIGHAGDRALLVDKSLLPLFEQIRSRINVEHVLVFEGGTNIPAGTRDYDEALSGMPDRDFAFQDLDEESAAAMCYSSGTTGRPKGVVYSHRAIVLLAMHWTAADTIAVSRRDVIMSVVPMFHINGWGLPFTAAHVGAKIVLPGSRLAAPDLLGLITAERVTLSAGVPTIWLSVLHALAADSSAYDVSSLRLLVVGGAAVPEALVRGFRERHDVHVTQAWGMTETTSLASVSTLPADLAALPPEAQYRWHTRQGWPLPLVEIRARGREGLVPWDGETAGELEVRGPTVASAYYNSPEGLGGFTSDGWLQTGDIVTIDPRGCIEIRDRAKDLIKSGGEWISSVALENALVEHPSVAEAAVIAVPDVTWGERPLAVVALLQGAGATTDDLRRHLEPRFPKWCLPDTFVFVDEIPKTGTGKFLKTLLRERYRNRVVE
jgi:fatty-acyl-CoA synthase